MTAAAVFAPDLGRYDDADRRELARELRQLADAGPPDVAAAVRQLAGAVGAAGPVAADFGALAADLRTRVRAALMGAVEARRQAGYPAAGPILTVAAEWEWWERHSGGPVRR